MRQHLRQSRPGRPCGAPARRSRGRPPPGGKTGAGSVIGSKNRGRGAVPLPADLGAGGRSRRSERPSARTRRGVGEPALRPASIGFDKTRGGAGGPRHVPDRQTPASGSARAVPENSIVLRSRFPLRPRRHPGPVRAMPPGPCGLAVPPDVEPVGRSGRAGGATPRPGPPGRSPGGGSRPGCWVALEPPLASAPRSRDPRRTSANIPIDPCPRVLLW
jgi:translation initiation factor IF-2